MPIHQKGGEKRTWKTKKQYQQHLREVALQGKGFKSDGTIDTRAGIGNDGMFDMRINGYNFNKKYHKRGNKE